MTFGREGDGPLLPGQTAGSPTGGDATRQQPPREGSDNDDGLTGGAASKEDGRKGGGSMEAAGGEGNHSSGKEHNLTVVILPGEGGSESAVDGADGIGNKDVVAGGGPSAGEEAAEPVPNTPYLEVTYLDITKEFSLLGWIAFGGPAAHIGLFQKRLVEKKKWMSDNLFMELFSLAGCLPGPTSTQVSFSLGTVKKGVLGGLLGGALFQYPGAVIMTGFGIASAKALNNPPAWLAGCASGVSAVGVALVASASKGLLMKVCYDATDKAYSNVLCIIAVLAAGAAIYWRTFPWLYPLLIFLGGVGTLVWNWKKDMSVKGDGDEKIAKLGINMWGGATLLVIWASILTVVLVLVRLLNYDHRVDDTPLDWFEVFYRIGSIIYGGGQVVLPLLLTDLVKTSCNNSVSPPICVDDAQASWVSTLQFYTGLGVVQAMPGPLFNFAAYLGAIIAWNAGYNPLVGVVLCWLGLFGPGILLMFGCLPFWEKFRKWQPYRRALPGANAASVGLILASVFRMTLDVYALSTFPQATLVIGLWAFAAVDELGIFEPWVVIAGIGLGALGWGAGLS